MTLNLAATDDVAVDKFQYSIDGGVTYVDVQVADAPSATTTVAFSQEGNTAVRYRAVDTSGNISLGVFASTTLNQASAAGATAIRLTSTAGRAAGDVLVIDTGAAQETVTIASIPTPAPASPAPNVVLSRRSRTRTQQASRYRHPAVPDDQRDDRQQGADPGLGHPGQHARRGCGPGATGVRLASTTGRAVGETLQIDQGENAETVTIASIVTPAPAAPAPNVTLTSPLTKTHLSGAGVYLPSIIGGKVLQSQTLTPLRNDPRLRDATDTVTNGAGGAAIRRMIVDGKRSSRRRCR